MSVRVIGGAAGLSLIKRGFYIKRHRGGARMPSQSARRDGEVSRHCAIARIPERLIGAPRRHLPILWPASRRNGVWRYLPSHVSISVSRAATASDELALISLRIQCFRARIINHGRAHGNAPAGAPLKAIMIIGAVRRSDDASYIQNIADGFRLIS